MCGFIISRSNGAKLLEPAEEVLDQVPLLVEIFVVIALRCAAAFWGNHGGFPCRGQRLKHPFIHVKGFIGDYGIGLDIGKKHIGALQIVSLSRCEMEGGWVSPRINNRMDFGAQSAS